MDNQGGPQSGGAPKRKLVLAAFVVVVLVVVGAVVYYFLLSQGGGSSTTPHCVMIPRAGADYSFTISNLTREIIDWSLVEIRLVNVTGRGMQYIWDPPYQSLVNLSGGAATETFLGRGLWDDASDLAWCEITDIHGDGLPENGDYFVLNLAMCTFSPSFWYEIVLLYEDTASPIASHQFHG